MIHGDLGENEHWLMPTTVALLRKRSAVQAHERSVAPEWPTMAYDGEPVSLVFTTPTGGLVLRQTSAKIVKQAAKTAGITADLGTHAGRRTVVTTLFVDGDEALDIDRFVGQARPTTTAGYVKRLGRRAQASRQTSGRCARRPRRRRHGRGSE
jgi:site-specific recombinase XerD